MGDVELLLLGGVIAVAVGFAACWSLRLAHFKYITFKRSQTFKKQVRRYRYWIPASILGVLSFPAIAYLLKFFSHPISSTAAEWGQMGDFFGGMLNPILAFASFIALLYTIRLQSEELKLTREELAKSVKAQREMASNSEDQLILQIYQQSTEMFNSYHSTISGIYKKTESSTPPGQTPADLNFYITGFIHPEFGGFARSQVPTINMDDIRKISAHYGFALSLAKEVSNVLPGMVAELYSQNQLLCRSANVKSLLEGRFHSVYTGVVHEYARMLLFFRMTQQTIGRQDGEIAFERKIIDDAINHLSNKYFNGKAIEQ